MTLVLNTIATCMTSKQSPAQVIQEISFILLMSSLSLLLSCSCSYYLLKFRDQFVRLLMGHNVASYLLCGQSQSLGMYHIYPSISRAHINAWVFIGQGFSSLK